MWPFVKKPKLPSCAICHKAIEKDGGGRLFIKAEEGHYELPLCNSCTKLVDDEEDDDGETVRLR